MDEELYRNVYGLNAFTYFQRSTFRLSITFLNEANNANNKIGTFSLGLFNNWESVKQTGWFW